MDNIRRKGKTPPRRNFQKMDAHLLARFYRALAPCLTGARLEKIQEPCPGFLTLTLFAGGRKTQLCWRSGRKEAFAFPASDRITANVAPSAQIMRLRKYAAGRRVGAHVLSFMERRLWLLLERPARAVGASEPAGLVWLCLDLHKGPSLHFLTAEAIPEEDALCWPAPDRLVEACAQWRQWPALTPALRRTLACLDERDGAALLVDLKEGGGNVYAYRRPGEQEICAASAWPLPEALRGGLVEEEGEDVRALLEKAGQGIVLRGLAALRDKAAHQECERLNRKWERLRERLREDEERLTAMLAAQSDALALRENLWRLPSADRGGSITVAAGEHGPQREIRLQPGRTATQEMEALFHTAKRGRRGLEHLARRRAVLEEEIEEIAAHAGTRSMPPAPPGAGDAPDSRAATSFPATLPKNVHAFVSDDGFVLLRGRDARGNVALRKLAAPHDIWLHVENGPGAHVVIRRDYAGQTVPERTLVQAGSLAASKSWAAEAGRADIVYAEMRHVKTLRNASPGTVRIDKVSASILVDIDAALEDRLAAAGRLPALATPGT